MKISTNEKMEINEKNNFTFGIISEIGDKYYTKGFKALQKITLDIGKIQLNFSLEPIKISALKYKIGSKIPIIQDLGKTRLDYESINEEYNSVLQQIRKEIIK